MTLGQRAYSLVTTSSRFNSARPTAAHAAASATVAPFGTAPASFFAPSASASHSACRSSYSSRSRACSRFVGPRAVQRRNQFLGFTLA